MTRRASSVLLATVAFYVLFRAAFAAATALTSAAYRAATAAADRRNLNQGRAS